MGLIRRLKDGHRRLRKAYYRHFGGRQLTRTLRHASPPLRVVLGAGERYDTGWIPTQKHFLKVHYPQEWARYFVPESIDALLAEHVWEHLTPEDARRAVETCFMYLKPGGYFRFAVPDGCHPDPAYIKLVDIQPGPELQPNDHKVLYTYQTARQLFEAAGFRVRLLEYYDEAGVFHAEPWSERQGTIWRSKRFDKRNQGGRLAYTSIVLDAVKPA
jgi:predicted SAM-dependent methyltransferase